MDSAKTWRDAGPSSPRWPPLRCTKPLSCSVKHVRAARISRTSAAEESALRPLLMGLQPESPQTPGNTGQGWQAGGKAGPRGSGPVKQVCGRQQGSNAGPSPQASLAWFLLTCCGTKAGSPEIVTHKVDHLRKNKCKQASGVGSRAR